MMSIRIADKYTHLKAFIESIPERMEHEGETIHNGRNLIKVMQTPDGLSVNVKRYHAPHFLNAIIYSTSLRTPKGQRAYEYPSILLSKGVETPEAVAYIECPPCSGRPTGSLALPPNRPLITHKHCTKRNC